MGNPIKILICDDNIAVHESLSAYLKQENMNCVSAYDGEEGLKWIQTDTFDLVILDIMMPKLSGTDLCREVRMKSEVPIIMLSARGEAFDRILGLELGADDYIIKPFSPREVVTRIRTILKRIQPPKACDEKLGLIKMGDMTIDPEGYKVTIKEKSLEFTPKAVELLIYFYKNKNRVLSREQILNQIWGYDYLGDTRAVDTLIKRMRKRLPEGFQGFDLKSIYGMGYKMEVNE